MKNKKPKVEAPEIIETKFINDWIEKTQVKLDNELNKHIVEQIAKDYKIIIHPSGDGSKKNPTSIFGKVTLKKKYKPRK
jgi:hypothetical protein